ncbi:MAG: cysteine-rich CWC family protein [Telluria sp.]
MSICTRCGAPFGCAMVDGGSGPCWCTTLPPVVPVPDIMRGTADGAQDAVPGCLCPACLRQHIAQLAGTSSGTP